MHGPLAGFLRRAEARPNLHVSVLTRDGDQSSEIVPIFCNHLGVRGHLSLVT